MIKIPFNYRVVNIYLGIWKASSLLKTSQEYVCLYGIMGMIQDIMLYGYVLNGQEYAC